MPDIFHNRLPASYYLVKQNLVERARRLSASLAPGNSLQRDLQQTGINCFMIYQSDCASRHYRLTHSQHNLDVLNLSSRMLSLKELESLKHFGFLRSPGIVILHRLPMTVHLKHFVKACRNASVKIILDLDDAIHDPDIYQTSALFDLLTPLEKKLHLNMARRVGDTLSMCDAVTVSTHALADLIAHLNKPVWVLPNRVSPEMMDAISQLHQRDPPNQTMGYMSGSETHHRDLESISEPLQTIFQDFPAARLILAGPVPVPGSLQMFSDRITQLPFKPWPEHLAYYQRVNMVLCPLEPDNPFCMAKSGIKYLEAGISAVPAIASPTGDFKRLIQDAHTGYLAGSTAEWTHKIRYALTHPDTLKEIGKRAQKMIREHELTDHNLPVWQSGLHSLGIPV
jgi:O-antigen biosynthesis protein